MLSGMVAGRKQRGQLLQTYSAGLIADAETAAIVAMYKDLVATWREQRLWCKRGWFQFVINTGKER